VNALDPRAWPELSQNIRVAQDALKLACVKADSDRTRILTEAAQQLQANMGQLVSDAPAPQA